MIPSTKKREPLPLCALCLVVAFALARPTAAVTTINLQPRNKYFSTAPAIKWMTQRCGMVADDEDDHTDKVRADCNEYIFQGSTLLYNDTTVKNTPSIYTFAEANDKCNHYVYENRHRDGCDALRQTTCHMKDQCAMPKLINASQFLHRTNLLTWEKSDNVGYGNTAAPTFFSIAEKKKETALGKLVYEHMKKGNTTVTITFQDLVDTLSQDVLDTMDVDASHTTKNKYKIKYDTDFYISTIHNTTQATCEAHLTDEILQNFKETDDPIKTHGEHRDTCGLFILHQLSKNLGEYHQINHQLLLDNDKCVIDKAKDTSTCLLEAKIGAAHGLWTMVSTPENDFCDDGMKQTVQCMPKCACNGGTMYETHLYAMTNMSGVFTNGTTCLTRTMYDDLCGQNRVKHGMPIGFILLIIGLILLVIFLVWYYGFHKTPNKTNPPLAPPQNVNEGTGYGCMHSNATPGMYFAQSRV